MRLCVLKYSLVIAILDLSAVSSAGAFTQRPEPGPGPTRKETPGTLDLSDAPSTLDLDIYVKGPDGAPLAVMAVVTVASRTGQICNRGTTTGGNIRFSGLAPGGYTIQVVAAGFQNAVEEFDGRTMGAVLTIEMRPLPGEEGVALNPSQVVLAPKAQKEVGKVLEALRSKKLTEARSHLNMASRLAPNHPDVNYLFGVYFWMMKDEEKAKSYWTKTLEFDPKHLRALLSLGDALIREKRLADAESYVKRGVEADPSSWRAHGILADIYLKRHSPEEAIKQAEHALELGHGRAASIQPLLARALVEGGNAERARRVLQEYIQEHPTDAAARKQLENLLGPTEPAAHSGDASTIDAKRATETEALIDLPLPSNWLPSDVDEKVPPVEPGAACILEQVVESAGKRMQEFIGHVDQFTATESLVHSSINKFGLPSSPETRKFDYIVSIEESRPGFLSVEEYRGSHSGQNEFPDGVATNGLPALALIFHPYNAKNFDMSCEGLGRWSGGLAWQIHFRQRADRPNTMRAYRLGVNGPSYPVALRGRAWIAADSYQIVRLETDLVASIPEIRLYADHTAIEYGPVRFRNRDLEMWLPQSAEVYYDWRGRRSHRRHSFSNYFLFSVDEKQKISVPKVDTETPPAK
jgi:Flp pilus assembly protein TadD